MMSKAMALACAVVGMVLGSGCTPGGTTCNGGGTGGYGLGGGDVVVSGGAGGSGSVGSGGGAASGGAGGNGSVGSGGVASGNGAGGGDACFGTPATQYIDCRKRGLNADACSAACLAAGTGCGPFAGHPYKSGEGLGQLTWCKNGQPTYTCTYTFASGDGCAGVYVSPSYSPFWVCVYK